MKIPENPVTGDLEATPKAKGKAPWWAAIITTVVMALGGASGAILNYLDNRDARRLAKEEAATEGAVNAVWIQKQMDAHEKEIARLKAELMVSDAKMVGLNRRLELLEQRSGRSAVRASRAIRIEVPDKEIVQEKEEAELKRKRPPKPKRSDPDVQQMIKGAFR